MGIKSGDNKIKLMSGDAKIKRAYAGDVKIYSSGNIVTYCVDTGVTYQEEVDEGASCLSPTSFTVPEKSGFTFAGWSLKSGGNALIALVMGTEPIMLYAVWDANSFEMVLETTNWVQKTTSGYVKSIEMRANEYASQGISLLLAAANNQVITIAGYYKTINTRGLPKVDIYLNNYHEGGVKLGDSDTGYLGNLSAGDKVVTLNLAASQSQQLYVYAQANVGDPWQQFRTFHVKKLVFHN